MFMYISFFLELTKMKIRYMLILLTCVGVTSCVSHVCDGYSQWVNISPADHPGISKDKLTGHNISYYTSLETAMKVKNLNDTCIVVEENIHLKEDIVRKNIFKFLLTSNSNSSIQITCDNQRSVGIAFYKSTNILISNLHFVYCGGNRLMKRTCEGGNCLNISTSLYFHGSVNISVNNVCLNRNFGYGLSIVDSNVVLLNNVNVKNSNNFQLENIIQRQHVPGGGLYVEYSPNYHAHRHVLQLTNCIFIENNASTSNLISLNKTLPFGKGGGITLLYLGNAVRNTFHSSKGYVSSNEAISGGAVYIYFSENAINNTVILDKKFVMHNIAIQKGGGFYIVQKKNNNNIHFVDVFISNNNAIIGGCVFSIVENKHVNIFSSQSNREDSNGRMFFRNCQFSYCEGKIGAAMYFQRMYINFHELHVEYCQTKKSGYGGHGAVYVLDSLINLHGGTIIKNNNVTGFILNYSTMKLFNKTKLSHNHGHNGGALSLYDNSRIILTSNSVLVLRNNSATNKGGAIYCLTNWISIKMSMDKCFIGFEDGSPNNFNGAVIFENNIAGFGNDIFSSTVKKCMQPNESSLNDVIAKWPNFQFTNTDNDSIVTDPIYMDFYNTSSWKNVYPGKFISPHIHLRDERNNQVQSEAIIIVSNNVSIEQNKGLIVGKNSKIHFRLLGNENTRYNITIKTTSGVFLSRTLENLILKFCPFGFMYGKKVRKCICDYEHNRAHGIAECNEKPIVYVS